MISPINKAKTIKDAKQGNKAAIKGNDTNKDDVEQHPNEEDDNNIDDAENNEETGNQTGNRSKIIKKHYRKDRIM